MAQRLANELLDASNGVRRFGQAQGRPPEDGRTPTRPSRAAAGSPPPTKHGHRRTPRVGTLPHRVSRPGQRPGPPLHRSKRRHGDSVSSPSRGPATSGSWPTSTRARPRRPSASSTTPASTYKIGEVHEGTAVMDWMVQEQERGITITSAATTCVLERPPHQHHRHARPRGLHRRGRALAARARRRGRRVRLGGRRGAPDRDRCGARPTSTGCPRICFINKMDRIGADFFRTVCA